MRNKKFRLAAAALAAAMLLTGCVGKASGGALTKTAMKALESGDYSGALDTFSEAIAEGEDEVPAYRGKGLALMALARYEEAQTALNTALSFTDSKMPETTRDLQMYIASASLRGGKYEDTINVCETLNETKEEADIDFYMGAAYLGQGDQVKAKEYFDRATNLDPKNYLLYLHIYERYDQENLTADGQTYLQSALNIPSESKDDDCRIAQIYYYLGKYEDARSAIASGIDDKYVPALELAGKIYLAQEDYPHAAAAYNAIMEKDGESPAVYNGLAMCSIASGDYDAALDYISKGLALESEDGRAELEFNEITAYEKKLDFNTAYAKAQAYVEKYPTDEAGQKEYKFLSTRV